MAEEPAPEEADAPDTSDSGADPDADAERAARKDHGLRRRVWFFLSPLIATLLVPWSDDFSWRAVNPDDSLALLVIPALALVAVLAAHAKKLSLPVRSVLIGLAGVALGWFFFDLLSTPLVIEGLHRQVRRLDAFAFYLLLGLPLVAVTLELFAALDRRSRSRALLAGLGWFVLLAGYFVPLRTGHVDSVGFLMVTEAIDDASRHEEYLFFAGPLVLLFLTALANTPLALLRIIGDSARRERWRPRSGCMGLIVGVLPAVLFVTVASFIAFGEDIELLGVAFNGGAYVLGFLVGVPAALASGLDGFVAVIDLARGRGEPEMARRARIGLGVAAAVALVWLLVPLLSGLLPDGREDRAAEELLDIAQTIVDTSMGAEVEPRFVGGYSEFDLRGSRGSLESVIGAGVEPTLEYATFEVGVSAPAVSTVLVGVSPDGVISYLGGRFGTEDWPRGGALHRASEPLAGLAERIVEGLATLRCLPVRPPPDLPGLSDSQETLAHLCHGGVGEAVAHERIQDIGRSAAGGSTGGYRLWIRGEGATIHRLEGRLFSDGGRLWIGRADRVDDAGDAGGEQ